MQHTYATQSAGILLGMAGMEEFGALIKSARERRGLTQAGLGARVGYSPNFVNRLEAGSIKNPPTPETLRELERLLGLPGLTRMLLEAMGYLSAEDAGHDKAGLGKIHARLDQSLSVLSERDLQVVIELAEFLARTSDPASPPESEQQHDDPAPTIGVLSGDDEPQ